MKYSGLTLFSHSKTKIISSWEIGLIACIGNPNFSQNERHGAKFGKTVLKKVDADKGGKQKPVGAYPVSQRNADQNECSSNDVNPIVDDHDDLLFFLFRCSPDDLFPVFKFHPN